MIGFILDVFQLGLFTILAWGALVLAPVLYLNLVRVPLPSKFLKYLAGACLLVSAYSFGHVDGIDIEGKRSARLSAQIKLMEEKARLDRQIIDKANIEAQKRAVENERLKAENDEYEKELAAGESTRCPDDPAYRNRMRNIINQAKPTITNRGFTHK